MKNEYVNKDELIEKFETQGSNLDKDQILYLINRLKTYTVEITPLENNEE